jgi:hypothetical protein
MAKAGLMSRSGGHLRLSVEKNLELLGTVEDDCDVMPPVQ